MIEAVILGSGTSNGVPMLGVEYPPEYLAEPKNHRTRSSAILLGPEGNLLIDCAPELRLQMVREGLRRIDGVLITHAHADHVMGMDDLRSICILEGRDMPVWTLPRYQDDIRRIFPYAFGAADPGVAVPRYDLRDVPDVLEFAGMEVRTFTVPHGKVPVIGIRVENFAYLTDVSEIPPCVEPLLEGLDTLILDAVRRRPHPNHFHFERAVSEAQRIGARRTYLTHLSHDYDHHVTNQELPDGIELAWDGLRIHVA